MSKAIRILVVFACMAVVVGVGLNGAAWADKLNAGEQAPAASALNQGVAAGSRPKGTVITTPECVKTLVPGKFTIGSIAEWIVESHGGSITATSQVGKGTTFSARLSR